MMNNSQAMILGSKKGVRYATAARQPTLIIIAKVTVRTRTIDLNVLLGGTSIDVDIDGSLNFSMESLLVD
jgi:hypothetical protein